MQNGGCLSDSIGYCLFIQHDGLGFQIRYEIANPLTKIAALPLYEWHHITVSHNDTHTNIYVNGCPAQAIFTHYSERTIAIVPPSRLTFGYIEGSRPAHVAMDQLAIW